MLVCRSLGMQRGIWRGQFRGQCGQQQDIGRRVNSDIIFQFFIEGLVFVFGILIQIFFFKALGFCGIILDGYASGSSFFTDVLVLGGLGDVWGSFGGFIVFFLLYAYCGRFSDGTRKFVIIIVYFIKVIDLILGVLFWVWSFLNNLILW